MTKTLPNFSEEGKQGNGQKNGADLGRFIASSFHDSIPFTNAIMTPNAGLTYQGQTGWGNAVIGHDNSGRYGNWNEPYQGLSGDQFAGLYNLLYGSEEGGQEKQRQNGGLPSFGQERSSFDKSLGTTVNPYSGVSPEFLRYLMQFGSSQDGGIKI